ncbi:MAG: cysteine desulfurase [Planctomycetes bacterium]|nr:cysteine desulfurase [Planctomycetota bacterium]
MDLIYLDNSASTPMLPEVWEAMRRCLLDRFGNPASSHRAGRQARQAIEDAREQIANLLEARPDEVIFTSGATEANNLALFGLCGDLGGQIAISSIEHPCVTEPARALARRGFTLSTLPVDEWGVLQIPPVQARTELRLVSVQLANHETGAIQPIRELTLNSSSLVHCDAAAAAGKLPISFRDLGVSALTMSAHKFHGPKGIGALILKKGTKLQPMLWGGHQQSGKRPGTEPVPLAVGMAAALAIATREMEANTAKAASLRKLLLERLRAHVGPAIVNGPEVGGIPHVLNVSLPGCAADVLLMKLDLAGVACATGSACSSGSLLPSPVLQAMGISGARLQSAMRFSFSGQTELSHVEEAARRIIKCVNDLRESSCAY